MLYQPNPTELQARARADLRMGVPVILRENSEARLVFAAETLNAARFAAFEAGTEVAITARRAQTLNLPVYDGDLTRIALPARADLTWINALANPAQDLMVPLKGPFQAIRDGHAHLHRAALRLLKQARMLPTALICPLPDGIDAGRFTQLDIAEMRFDDAPELISVSGANLPLEVSETSRLHIFRPKDGSEEHYAIEIGTPNRDSAVLARLHSACFTGDLIGSLKCDCGPQLRAALAAMGEHGSGVLLYLNQEGRGIGLANKMRAYSLQNQGFDTVEANHRLGFEDDERDFRIGAEILQMLGFSSVRLLTNNPLKIKMMEACGVAVAERVPLIVGENAHNQGYLSTKARKSGHML